MSDQTPNPDQAATAEFNRRVTDAIAAGESRDAATRNVCRAFPELRAAFVRDHNRRGGPAPSAQRTTPGPASQRFDQLVAEGMARGLTRQSAVREVAVQHPDAHRTFLSEHNAARAGRPQRAS